MIAINIHIEDKFTWIIQIAYKNNIDDTLRTKISSALKRGDSSVVEYSSTNTKVPGLIPGPVSYQGHGL